MTQQTVAIGDTGQQLVDKLDNNFDELYASQLAEDNQLIEWAGGKDVESLVRTIDSVGRTTSATLKWPDESLGTFTATDFNATFGSYDGWTRSHTDSGKTVTQAAYTRNSIGAITNKPALTVA
jgi:hypothetical protein